MSARPLSIIETEADLTRTAIVACDRLIRTALEIRRDLLADGWPVGHIMCKTLDEVAERWAGEREHQRRVLADLLDEVPHG